MEVSVNQRTLRDTRLQRSTHTDTLHWFRESGTWPEPHGVHPLLTQAPAFAAWPRARTGHGGPGALRFPSVRAGALLPVPAEMGEKRKAGASGRPRVAPGDGGTR